MRREGEGGRGEEEEEEEEEGGTTLPKSAGVALL